MRRRGALGGSKGLRPLESREDLRRFAIAVREAKKDLQGIGQWSRIRRNVRVGEGLIPLGPKICPDLPVRRKSGETLSRF